MSPIGINEGKDNVLNSGGSDSRPLILVTNDDGIYTHGIQELAVLMSGLGDVIVAAPRDHQSGMSQAITVMDRLEVSRYRQGRTPEQYAISGTPCDCVKVALHALVPRRPDLVVSGINYGSNASINVLYSGTVGAALEGAIAGIPSIAYSTVREGVDQEGYKPYRSYILKLAREVLEDGLPWGVALNVNMPGFPIEGMVWCRQARARWTQDVESLEPDEDGKLFYRIRGFFESLDPRANDTDDYYLRERYITVVPTLADLTDRQLLAERGGSVWRPMQE